MDTGFSPVPTEAAVGVANASSGRISLNVCAQCRARKVKCDGQRDRCGTCERLGFWCSFSPQDPDQGQAAEASRGLRHRARRACLACRASKTRCIGEHSQCNRCRKKGFDCVFQPRSGLSPSSVQLAPPDSSSTLETAGQIALPNYAPQQVDDFDSGHRDTTERQFEPLEQACMALPSKETVMQTIEDFFRYIHPLSYFAFLHKASVIQGYVKGHADAALIFALCGLTSQMMGSAPETHQQAAKWIENAERMVLQSLDKPSIFKIQVILLIIGYKVHLNAMSSAFMLLTLASRFAFAMRLNYENPSLCWLAQESRRRVMWAIFILDTKAAADLPEFTTCPLDTIHVQLPCREEDFELDNPQITGSIESISQQPLPSIGLFTQYIRIINIRDRILRFTKQAAGSGKIGSNPAQAVRDFESELHLFVTTLPPSLVFSERNLLLRGYSSELSQYIMIHVWWHQCYCDLYRLLFDGLREAVSKRVLHGIDPKLISYCRSRCLDHARAMAADIFSTLLAVEVDIKIMDKDISVCAYQSARILFQGLQTSTERSSLLDESVLTQVGNCSAVLKKFCANSPVALKIAQEIEGKLAGRISSRSSLSEASSPAASVMASSEQATVSTPSRLRQVLSRHSYVRSSHFTDDSSKLVSPLENMNTDQQEPSLAFSPNSSVVRDNHSQYPKASGESTRMGSGTNVGHSNSAMFNQPLLPYDSAEGSVDASSFGLRVGSNDMVEGDWANDGAYQMAWSSFDPWISGTYDQDNWDAQDFMAGELDS